MRFNTRGKGLMRRIQIPAEIVTAALILALFTAGCATPALWEETWYHPAENPHLTLSLAPKVPDVLVQYDEQHGQSSRIRRRAYWLFGSPSEPDHRLPHFV